jgi:hypothetical protein
LVSIWGARRRFIGAQNSLTYFCASMTSMRIGIFLAARGYALTRGGEIAFCVDVQNFPTVFLPSTGRFDWEAPATGSDAQNFPTGFCAPDARLGQMLLRGLRPRRAGRMHEPSEVWEQMYTMAQPMSRGLFWPLTSGSLHCRLKFGVRSSSSPGCSPLGVAPAARLNHVPHAGKPEQAEAGWVGDAEDVHSAGRDALMTSSDEDGVAADCDRRSEPIGIHAGVAGRKF